MSQPKKSQTSQVEKFKEAARTSETNDSEDRFDKVLKHLARRTDDDRKVIEALDTAYERNKGQRKRPSS